MSAPPSFLRPVSRQENVTENQSVPSFLRPKKGVSETDLKTTPSFLKPKQEKDVDLEREIERNVAQQTSRGLETFGGMAGDLYQFAKSLLKDSPTLSKAAKYISPITSGLGEHLPTSESLRETSKKYGQGYLEPKSPHEERAGEIMQDISSFMVPGSGQYNLMRNIGIPIAANVVKEGIKLAGGEGDAAKIGTMVALDLALHRGKGAKSYAGSLFQESKQLVPKGQKINSGKLLEGMTELYQNLKKGGSSPSKSEALTKIKEIGKKSKKGEIEVEELLEFRKSINELLDKAKAFDITIDPKIKAKSIQNLQSVKSKVIGALDEYGKINPEFGKLNRAANEAWAVHENSKKMSQFITKILGKANPVTKIILGSLGSGAGVHLAHSGSLMTAVKGAALVSPAIAGGNEAFKIMYQITKSPVLAKFYGNILKGAAIGNAEQVSRNAERLEKAMKEESSE